jgi:hypothetical protein
MLRSESYSKEDAIKKLEHYRPLLMGKEIQETDRAQ